MLRQGSRGSAVEALQRKLGIPADGIFGPQTEAAVRRYQQSHGLTIDGVAGPETLGHLGLSGGSSSTSSGTKSTPAGGSTSAAEMAAGFGYSLAFFDSDPELRKLLDRATNAATGTYTTERFVAELQNTKWFRTHGEAYRKYIALQKSDPATLKQLSATNSAQILSLARSMGAVNVSPAQLQQLATQSIMFGWTQDQMRNALTSFVKTSNNGTYQGDAGAAAEKFKQIASDYGVAMSANTLGSFVKGSIQGYVNDAYVQQWASAQAASRYPALAEQLRAGQTLRQLADPYVQSYAQTLELNPDSIQLTDKTLQSALTAKDQAGKPSVKTLWQFEDDLRKDPRWLQTNNAREQLVGNTRQVLQDFGLVS